MKTQEVWVQSLTASQESTMHQYDVFTTSPLRSVGSSGSSTASPEPSSPLSSVDVRLPLSEELKTKGPFPYIPELGLPQIVPPDDDTSTRCSFAFSWMCMFDSDSPHSELDVKKDNPVVAKEAEKKEEGPAKAPFPVNVKAPFRSECKRKPIRKALPVHSLSYLSETSKDVVHQGFLPYVLEWLSPRPPESVSPTFYLPLNDSAAIRYYRIRRTDRLNPPLKRMHPLVSDSPCAFAAVDSETAAAAAADAKRRAPRAGQSMSLAPSAAAQISKQSGGPKAPEPHKKHAGQVAGPDLERVQVKTPGADRSALKDLAALRDAPPTKREELFVMKLKLCSVIFSFDDPTADKRGKDMKRQTLLELVDYVNTPAGQKIFTESVMGDLMAMVSANVCRALPPATDDFDPEEDEPVLEPAWPHLQVAYEFFLRFIVSSEVNAKAAKKYVDQKFCLQLVELFDSEDPRERDYLKTILHRIYGKFMSHRSFIRRAISNVFYRFVYETERHNGIGELLEILGSIINGFAIPLKKEHLQFLVRALIPLHKPKCVALYHQQLSYCIIQYVEKDADTATPILNGFFKCWPWSCSGKQVMFLNELEEILELLGADQLAQVSTMLFTNLARCLDSDHFQVVERALFLWNNEHLVNSGCLSRLNAQTVLPIIYGPLYKNSSGHWNATVEGLAQNVLKMYMEYDLALYDKCTSAHFREEEEAKKKLEALNDKWHNIEKMAAAKQPALLMAKS